MTRLPPPLLLGVLALVGCEEVTTCETLEPDDAWVEIGEGTAADAFTPIEPGVTLLVERGSQGGMHVWAALALGDLQPGSEDLWDGLRNGDLPTITLNLSGPHGRLTPDNERPQVLERGDGEYLLLHQQLQFKHFEELPEDWQELDYGEVEEEMETQDHTLSVRVEDSCGTVVQEEILVRLDFPARGGEEESPG